MTNQQLLDIAKGFRKAIENIPPEDRPIGMKLFPIASCGDTSLLFGAYLMDRGVTGFMYICGSRGDVAKNTWTSHAWLQRGSLVIDLTADQFQDAPIGVIVSNESVWHQQFRKEPNRESDFRKCGATEQLQAIYEQIIRNIAESSPDKLMDLPRHS